MLHLFSKKKFSQAVAKQAEIVAEKVSLNILNGFNDVNQHIINSMHKNDKLINTTKKSIEKTDIKADTNATNIALLSKSLMDIAQSVHILNNRLVSLENKIGLNGIKLSSNTKVN
jgi:hypothetical protein